MRTRTLGKTGLVVSELALGTWGLSGDAYGPVDEEVRDAVIDRALLLGITLFETADIYGKGAMEKALAARVPQEDKYVICTKIGTDLEADPKRKRFEPDYLKAAFERCQERMGRERLDLVLLHNPSPEVMLKGAAAETMQGFVNDGMLRAWGVSAGTRDVARPAIYKTPRPGVIQMPYNALYSAELGSAEYDIYSYGIGILARSVLAHGLLTGHWAKDKVFDKKDHRRDRWSPDQLARRIHQLKALRGLYSGDVRTVRGAALRFVLDNSRVSSAVLGPKDLVQLEQLVREAGKAPPYLPESAKINTTRRLSEMGAYR